MLWIPGYIDNGRVDHDEIHLPNFMKILYGKWNKPLYLRGALLQTLGIVFACGRIIEFWAFSLNQPILLPTMSLFILCIFFLGTAKALKLIHNYLQQYLKS